MDKNGVVRKQLLKVRDWASLRGERVDLSDCECWSSAAYFGSDPQDQFAQPFAIKAIRKDINRDELVDAKNWRIDMADSDTFIYSPWKE